MSILSIVIPTKNRYTTLFSLVDTLLSFDSNEFEIVIQDNSDHNESALAFLNERRHSDQLKYFHVPGKLSVIENSDLAVKHSTGEYVCFIGDDDGVMPYIIQVVKWMKKKGIKALKSVKPSYTWPGQKQNFLSNNTSGILKFERFNFRTRTISSRSALECALSKGGTSIKMLPCLYHGIVERTVLDRIYNQCGTYFPGPSPDMANAIALVKTVDEYVRVNFPVVISGTSAKSTGGQGVLHKHIASIEDVAHLPANTAGEWSDRIPKYWTGPTILAESLLKALQNCKDNESPKRLRYSYLYASLMVFNFNHRQQIFSGARYNIYSLGFFLDFIEIFAFRLSFFIRNRIQKKYAGIGNIGEAIKIIDAQADKKKLSALLD